MKKKHKKTEQIKRTRTAKAFKDPVTGKRFEDERGTKYIVTNSGGTMRKTEPKKLGNRQKRKLGLISKRGG